MLGEYERSAIDRLGFLLGAGILAAPATAALGVATGLPAIWAWVDQKNEAIAILGEIQKRVLQRLSRTAGYERHLLIAAAHTIIVAGAFFGGLRHVLGPTAYDDLALTSAEQKRLTLGRWIEKGEPIVDALYRSKVPLPSATRGFHENCRDLAAWYKALTHRTEKFLEGLSKWNKVSRYRGRALAAVAEQALEMYRANYLRLAADVPEFYMWATFGEHAATRSTIKEASSDILAAMDIQHRTAMERVERILSLGDRDSFTERDETLAVLYRLNRAALARPIVSGESQGDDTGVTFPSVEQLYVNPSYKIDVYDDVGSRPWDEEWWSRRACFDDLDVRLAAYVASPHSMRVPLVLLGHPGAGKSMLTEVFAARLPSTSYTVVRVPLRAVTSDSPVYLQIQEALDSATHGRLKWAELAHRSRETLRVVLLDGLDELLQASTSHRVGYLHEVAEFQQREADQDRPVAVIVTSRTVIADRVRIPSGTMVMRLQEFNESQIRLWLDIWRSANEVAIESGSVRHLEPDIALRYVELSSQPLLLMMLALYSADPNSPALSAELSTVALYRQLLTRFSEREVLKAKETRPATFDDAVADQLWRLSVAALGMFNRGLQGISDKELSSDLVGLSGGAQADLDDLGRRTIGQFFFVHAAEADVQLGMEARRRYEFLHATFGEYLVANMIVVEIAHLGSHGNERRGYRDVNDDFLFALLSHQPLAARSSILSFADQLFAERTPVERADASNLLKTLLTTWRNRQGSARFLPYQPLPPDHIRGMAAYSANLVLLYMVVGKDEHATLATLWPNDVEDWRSMVELWRAGLDQDAFRALLGTVCITQHGEILLGETLPVARFADVLYARLVQDKLLERRVRLGLAVFEGLHYVLSGDTAEDVLVSQLAAAVLRPNGQSEVAGFDLPDRLPDLTKIDVELTFRLLNMLLSRFAGSLSNDCVRRLVDWLIAGNAVSHLDPNVLALVVGRYPELLRDVAVLRQPMPYGQGAGASLLLLAAERTSTDEADQLRLKNLRHAIDLGHRRREDSKHVVDAITTLWSSVGREQIADTRSDPR